MSETANAHNPTTNIAAGARVLIVDDQAVCARFLSVRLLEEGCVVETATSGGQAVELGATFQPDILVSDWMLKDRITGIDVARELTRNQRRMQVIFFTGFSAFELTAKIRATGIEVFRIYEKPCRVELIVDGIREALAALPQRQPAIVPKQPPTFASP